MSQDLEGRVAIVTGAAVRIGREIAVALAHQGADLVVHYRRSRESAEEVAATIRRIGRRVELVAADLTRPLEAASAIFDAANRIGDADLLVNSASVFEDASLVDSTEEHFDRQLTVNLKAPYFLCRELARRLPGDRTGHILNLVDWRALRPPGDYLAYTASKAGLVALTKGLAQQLAPRLQVNAIAPGAILPPPGGDETMWRSQKLPEIPLQRTGEPSDIAQAAVYLMTSRFITGEVLHVTGGEQL